MKTLQALTEQMKGWRRSQRSRRGHPLGAKESPRNGTTLPVCKPRASRIPAPAIAAFAIISLTSAIGYRFYSQPQLKEGTLAPKTLVASRDVSVEDLQATETKRKAAQTGIIPVLKIDSASNQRMDEELDELLGEIDFIREIAGKVPWEGANALSVSQQLLLRRLDEEQWQAVLAALRQTSQFEALLPGLESESALAAAQLRNYAQQSGQIALEDEIARLQNARDRYQNALEALATKREQSASAREPSSSLLRWQQALLDLDDSSWETSKQALRFALQKMLVQGIPEGLPDRVRQQAALGHLQPFVPEDKVEGVSRLLLSVLQPNLTQDLEETKKLAEQAALEEHPVVYKVKKGSIIVREGEPLGRREFVLLDELGLSDRGVNWRGLILSAGLASGSFGLPIFLWQRLNLRLRSRDRILICLLSISAPLLVQFNVRHTNLSAIGLLASSFYHPTLAVTQVLLVSGLTAFSAIAPEGGMLVGWEYLIPSAVGGLIAALAGGCLRSREELALLGGIVGLAQGGVSLLVALIVSATPGTIWTVVLPGAVVCGLWGIAWCVVALGLSPYLERVFDLVTPIRLAELSNPNRPLLERLATETPGTFQHTLFVASLAEAAARELRANVELVRAGTLYHDIGKMHDPLGFIENQMGGPNKHDAIDDPWKSAEIVKKHVSEGLAIARRYNLPQAIRDFIPEHQGTILISYFYLQAQQRAQAEGKTVAEADFRYDGPIPQSRETGIVMLADACEAALRSLKDATPDIAIATVKKIFSARWRDCQLAESGLRQEELPTIAEVFVRVWQQYNHQRIAYPKAALDTQPAVRSQPQA